MADESPIRDNQPHVRYSAETYDDYTARSVQVFDEMMAARVLDVMHGRAPDAVLLDIGTGTARLLVHLAGLAPLQRVRFVGTDAFEDMVDRARQTVDAAGLTNRIEVHVDDVHDMRLGDAFADVVISRSTVHHWSNPSRAFAEIYRVLKPGGIAIVHDVRRDPAPEAIAEFNRQRALAGLAPSHLDEKLTVAEVVDTLRDAGLERVSRAKGGARGLGALGYEVVIEKPLS